MNAQLLQTAIPSDLTARWWPDLFLRRGRTLYAITPEQCGPLMERFRGGRGFSEMPCSSIPLCDVRGRKIGHISYNGRVWLHDVEGDVEIPVAGIKTCAQRDAEGWR